MQTKWILTQEEIEQAAEMLKQGKFHDSFELLMSCRKFSGICDYVKERSDKFESIRGHELMHKEWIKNNDESDEKCREHMRKFAQTTTQGEL